MIKFNTFKKYIELNIIGDDDMFLKSGTSLNYIKLCCIN